MHTLHPPLTCQGAQVTGFNIVDAGGVTAGTDSGGSEADGSSSGDEALAIYPSRCAPPLCKQ